MASPTAGIYYPYRTTHRCIEAALVEIEPIHARWKTGFLWWQGSVQWQEDAVFRLEPEVIT